MTDWKPLDIDSGLPGGRRDWPSGVLESLRAFTQGHVVRHPPLFYFADPTRAIWARTKAYTCDSPGPEVVESGQQAQPVFGVITSQTCDIAEEDAERPTRPWVQLSPAYDMSHLDGGTRKLLTGGRGNRYLFHLPKLSDGFWVADLRIEVPVEKSWLASQTPIDGFGDEDKQRRLGERLAHLRSRPAFAGTFVRSVQQPLVRALRALKTDNRSLYDTIDGAVDVVAVDLDSHLGRVSIG